MKGFDKCNSNYFDEIIWEEARAARLAEERRKRREAIMAKHAAAKQTSVRVDADDNAKDANAALPGGAATGPASETPPAPKEPVSAKPRPKPVSDMFAADDDEDEAEEREIARVSRLAAKGSAKGSAADMSRGLADNWDDADGYYPIAFDKEILLISIHFCNVFWKLTCFIELEMFITIIAVLCE